MQYTFSFVSFQINMNEVEQYPFFLHLAELFSVYSVIKHIKSGSDKFLYPLMNIQPLDVET